MADYKKLIPFIKQWEGGYVNDPDDAGGETNQGITIGTWKAFGADVSQKLPSVTVKTSSGKNKTYKNVTKTLFEISPDQWETVFRKYYWNPLLADNIESQAVANILVDWAWASGTKTSIKKIQSIVNVTVDGISGPKTIAAINAIDQDELYAKIYASRISFIDAIIARKPSQQKYEKGWKSRINKISSI